MPRKKQYVPKPFESNKGRGDISANIYASMIQSPAWKKLTKAQQSLYLHMKLQYYGAKKIPDMPETCFYFNQNLWQKTYNLYTNKASFYKDRNRLIEMGFIDQITQEKDFEAEQFGNIHPKAVYQLSDRWSVALK